MQDEAIVDLYWQRDQGAIRHTQDKYGHYLTKIAYNILFDPEDSMESVNDTYLHAWNSMPPNKPVALSAFLGKITRNLSINKYKQTSADKRGGGELPAVLEELSEMISGTEDLQQALDHKELTAAINAFLGTLSPEKRSIFLCRYWYADNVSTIAKRCGIREGTVSMTLHRLRGKLKRYLTERGFDL